MMISKKNFFSFLLAIIFTMFASTVYAQLYGFTRTVWTGSANDPSVLQQIDPATGNATLIGPTGVGAITAGTWDPTNGVVYASHGGGGCCPVALSGCLLQANITTGSVSSVGCDATYSGNDNMPGLAVDSNGNLYGLLLACNAGPQDCNIYLVSINKGTGEITLIGITDDWDEGQGIAFGAGDVLYYHNNGEGFGSINLLTGAMTPIGNNFIGFPNINTDRITDMAYDSTNNILYASASPGSSHEAYLAEVNPVTGDITYVSTLPDGTNAIFFTNDASPNSIPTLSEWGMVIFALFLGCSALWYMRRRVVL